MSTIRLALAMSLALMLTGCSLNKMAARQTNRMVILAIPAYDRETDLELAEQAIAANLKMLEGVLELSPDSYELLFTTSSSFGRYVFGFLEEKIEIADEAYDYAEMERLTNRAVNLYERARQYGLRAIHQKHKSFLPALGGGIEQLKLELQHFRRDDLDALFWTAFSWGGMINLSQDNPARLAELPVVKLIMKRILELDEGFYFASPHLFFGTFYGNFPEMLGGDPVKSVQHFKQAIKLTEGKYLMAKFLMARYAAVPAQDHALFEVTLKEVLAAPSDLFPDQGLANQIAKRRAARWLAHSDMLF